MKAFVIGAAAAMLAAAPAAWAQTTPMQGTTSNQSTPLATSPDGTSKPGVPGLPGNKSGPAVRAPSDAGSSGSSSAGSMSGSSTSGSPATTQQQDVSKVPGLPGNKSGPSTRSPGQHEQGQSPSSSGSTSR
jgi:hypothetical protein